MPTAISPEMVRPGGPKRSNEPHMSQAAARTKAGFRNSEGCRLKKPSEYQRVAPLPKSVPSQGSSAVANKAAAKRIRAQRRTRLSEDMEIAASALSPTMMKTAWRTT